MRLGVGNYISYRYAGRLCWVFVGLVFVTHAIVAAIDSSEVRLFGGVLGILTATLGYINSGMSESRIFWQKKLIDAQKRDIERLIMELSRAEHHDHR